MNRYDVNDSTIVVVSEDFITKWVKFRKKMGYTEAPVAKLNHTVKGWDEEEVTYLWMPTDKEVCKGGKEYMEQFLADAKDWQLQADMEEED